MSATEEIKEKVENIRIAFKVIQKNINQIVLKYIRYLIITETLDKTAKGGSFSKNTSYRGNNLFVTNDIK